MIIPACMGNSPSGTLSVVLIRLSRSVTGNMQMSEIGNLSSMIAKGDEVQLVDIYY